MAPSTTPAPVPSVGSPKNGGVQWTHGAGLRAVHAHRLRWRPRRPRLERELLELWSMAGETTTTLDEEMREASPGRVIEATLRSLLARGLLTTVRGTRAGERVYEDDKWT